MALFTDTRELDRQGRNKQFELATGEKKIALEVLGYNADGTKNTFGKTFGHGNVLMDSIIPGEIAGKDSDVGKVINDPDAEAAEMEKQNQVRGIVKGIMGMSGGTGGSDGGGGVSGIIGGMTGSGGGATGDATGGSAGAMAKTGSAGAVPDGTKAVGPSGTEIMSQAEETAAKNSSMDALNSGYSDQTISGVTTTNVEGANLSEEELANWDKYMEENPEGTMEDFQAKQKDGGKGSESGIEAVTDSIPIIGNVVGAITARSTIQNALISAKRGVTDEQNLQTFNYL